MPSSVPGPSAWLPFITDLDNRDENHPMTVRVNRLPIFHLYWGHYRRQPIEAPANVQIGLTQPVAQRLVVTPGSRRSSTMHAPTTRSSRAFLTAIDAAYRAPR
jgi:hypothetical protein